MKPNPFKRTLSTVEKEKRRKREEIVQAYKILRDHFKNGNLPTENLDLSPFPTLSILPQNIRCKELNLQENKELEELPYLQAERIDLQYTNIKSITEGLKCKELNLTGNTELEHLPLIQAEEIHLSFTNIKSITEGLKCKKLDLFGNKTLDEFPKRLECDSLYLYDTFFSKNYTRKEIRQEIEDKGGKVNQINTITI